MNRRGAAAVLVAVVVGTGCASLAGRWDRQQAGTLLKALREHEIAYKDAIHLHQRLGENSKTPSAEEIAELQSRFAHLHDSLAKVPVEGEVADRYLQPILEQLRREEADLALAAKLIAANKATAADSVIKNHDHAANLVTPTLTQIRRLYGFAPPRAWRGRPLTV